MTTFDRIVTTTHAPSGTATLDSAHVGDVEGALGRIRLSDNDRPCTRKIRLAALLAIVGSGLIVMVGDNGAGGVAILLVVKAIQLGST